MIERLLAITNHRLWRMGIGKGVVARSGAILAVEDFSSDLNTCKRKPRYWRKLHLGLDLVSREIVCSDLTTDDVGDPKALSEHLNQVDGPVALFLADRAYDGEPTSDLLTARFGSSPFLQLLHNVRMSGLNRTDRLAPDLRMNAL